MGSGASKDTGSKSQRLPGSAVPPKPAIHQVPRQTSFSAKADRRASINDNAVNSSRKSSVRNGGPPSPRKTVNGENGHTHENSRSKSARNSKRYNTFFGQVGT